MIKDTSDSKAIAPSIPNDLQQAAKEAIAIQDIQDQVNESSSQARSVGATVIEAFDTEISQGRSAIADYVQERIIRMPYEGIAEGVRRVGGEAATARPFQFASKLGIVPDLKR